LLHIVANQEDASTAMLAGFALVIIFREDLSQVPFLGCGFCSEIGHSGRFRGGNDEKHSINKAS